MKKKSVPLEPGFPIVGLGASAGGLAAFESFFSGVPSTATGVAIVLVQHLDPDHKSLLTELVKRYTRMEVFEVKDGMTLRPECVYIIPPGKDLAVLGGTLQLLEPSEPRGRRLPIDFFFQSLAQDRGEKAVAVVLSGTGSDGTLGIRSVKAAGGLVLAQSPDTTEYDGMPASALATGLVDFELPPNEMPARILAFFSHAGSLPNTGVQPLSPFNENTISKVFILLRNRTGHDFSQYKPSTLHRRIVRRMAVHQLGTLEDYAKYLQQTPFELDALFQDLLIGVTNFFRDPEAFRALEEQILPLLLDNREPGIPVRVWSAGCSTGEEAYSVAILLQERLEARRLGESAQVFATDIDPRAIARARAGVYPAGIAADVTPERLSRFFTLESDGAGFRVRKNIRDMMVFSEQDVVKDPPFSKLDLIICRNLLIYLGPELQSRLIPLFHYALNPAGMLFLGTSESIGEFGDLFSTLDRKAKIFRRQEHFSGARRTPLGRFLPPAPVLRSVSNQAAGKAAFPSRLPLREVTEQALLKKVASAAALVSGLGDILYLHGHAGTFLEPASGVMGISNILKMAREGLRYELTVALRKVVETKEPVRRAGLQVQTNGSVVPVDLMVCQLDPGPQEGTDSPFYLVVLQESWSPRVGLSSDHKQEPSNDVRVEALQLELQAQEEALQTTNDLLESTNEELKSSNQEMQSINEELQSTNEELETSKEELQSVNEELGTVNVELQNSVTELSRANNDMNNLLAGTGIATVFIDHDLRILRFTPTAMRIINLIPGDLGRPVGHLVNNLVGYDRLLEDIQGVLDTLVPMEVDVQTSDGLWFALRIQPYRTLDNVIEGAVLSFVEITEVVLKREALRKANELLRLAVVVRDANDAITVQDLEGRTLAWNPGAVRMYGWTEVEALGMSASERIPVGLQKDDMARIRQLSRADVLEPYRSTRIAKDGTQIEISLTSTALVNEAGEMYAIATTERKTAG